MTDGGKSPAGRSLLDWKAVLGVLISAGLLWYAFRDVHVAEIWSRIRQANLPLLLLSSVVVTLPFPLRALRWRPLLEPALPHSRFRSRYAATCIGFMANNLLPARVGEFARAFALSRLEPVSVSASFGSLVVERMFDGVVVVLFLLIALAWPTFPDVSGRDFSGIAFWMAGVLLVLFAIMLALVIRPERSVRWFERAAGILPRGVRRRVVDALEAFLEGLAAVREGRLVVKIFLWSLLTWLAASLGMWFGLLAFDIDVPFVAALFLNSVIALAVALPSAPGFFGVYEAAARIGLVEVWGVASSPALAFAIGFHMAGFVPITVMGLYYLWRLGISWRDVGRSEDSVETAVEDGR